MRRKRYFEMGARLTENRSDICHSSNSCTETFTVTDFSLYMGNAEKE